MRQSSASEKVREVRVLEYGSIGVAGPKRIIPLFHHSNTPVYSGLCKI